MRLSSRIYTLAGLVMPGETVADIGTDHGYVPMLLVRDGISPRVIMSDISEGSLAKAIDTFHKAGLSVDERDFRTGNGLETIESAETDAVIIAGLGGHTIVDILSADISKSKSFNRLILQPRKHSGALRHYLYTNGWAITDEILSQEGKFECEIIVAIPSAYNKRDEVYPADDIRWKYPEKMYRSNPELAASRIKWKLGSINKQIDSLKSSGSDKTDLIAALERDMDYLRDLITEIK